MPLNAARRLGWFRVLVAAELAFGLLVAGSLWLLRAQTLDGEAQMLDALAHAMALQADRTLDMGEVVLKATADELARSLVAPSGPVTEAVLRERARALPGFRALSLFDTEGRRLATSRPASAAPPQGVAGRDFMRVASDTSAPARPYLSAPYVALGDGQPAVSLSLPWFDTNGRWAGVVALVAAPDFLSGGLGPVAGEKGVHHALLRAVPVAPGEAGAQGVVTIDGPPDLPQGLGRAFDATGAPQPLAALVLAHGEQRVLATAQPLKEGPYVQLVWRDVNAVLAGWNDVAWLAGLFLLAMLVVTWGLGLRMARDQLQVEGLERRLARSRQLESLGQLAGGVAHDFNNVLAAVVGFGELARDEAPPHSRQARHLDQVLQAAERGRQQVERILGFSRGQARRSVVFALQPVVQEVLDHLAASMRPEVQLQPTLQAAAQGVRGDPTATYEAVMNLCTNALQAMPAGGRLAVQLQALHVAAALQTYDTSLAPGHYLCLQVRDTGQGMSTEVLAHLFEPFFTTKGRQGGTGIGLAVVHGVVADLGGGIQVQSKPGHGTTFTLWLPVAAEQAPASAPALPPDEEPRGQGQVVLVVDDEPALVELAEEMLAALGYEPLGTVSSEQALQAVRDDPARFDLLLTDEVMPGLTGTALARAVHALRPGLPVLLASGYGGEHFEGRAAEAGVQAVLAKPLGRRQLAQAVHAALQAA